MAHKVNTIPSIIPDALKAYANDRVLDPIDVVNNATTPFEIVPISKISEKSLTLLEVE